MATKTAGGRITGRLALTVEASVALQVGDYVHLTGPYTVALADGTKPILGHVSVKNVKRVNTDTSSTFPVGNPGGDVTIEALGFHVDTNVAGEAIDAGEPVGVNATGDIVGVLFDAVNRIGIALTTTTGAGQKIDILGQ